MAEGEPVTDADRMVVWLRATLDVLEAAVEHKPGGLEWERPGRLPRGEISQEAI